MAILATVPPLPRRPSAVAIAIGVLDKCVRDLSDLMSRECVGGSVGATTASSVTCLIRLWCVCVCVTEHAEPQPGRQEKIPSCVD